MGYPLPLRIRGLCWNDWGNSEVLGETSPISGLDKTHKANRSVTAFILSCPSAAEFECPPYHVNGKALKI
jgi:hypothetical protein